jgi:hypothetical protein
MDALGTSAKKFDRKDPTRHKKIKFEGRDVHLSIHGVWRPINGEGGLNKQILRNTDLLLVSIPKMFQPEGKTIRKPVELWEDAEAMKLLNVHKSNGNILIVPGDLSDKELRKEIKKRMK